MRAFCFSCCATLSLLFASTAQASPLVLTWTAPPACPSESSVQDAVAFAIGDTAQGADPITASITVVEHDQLWRASIVTKTRSGTGTRELEGANCQEVTTAAVVVLSLLLRENAEISAEESTATGTGSDVDTAYDAVAPEVTAPSDPRGPDDSAPTTSKEETSSSLPSKSSAPNKGSKPAPPTEPKTQAPVVVPPDRFLVRAAASITLRDALPLEGGAQVGIARYQGPWGAEFSIGARTPLRTVSAAEEVAIELTSIDFTAAPCARWATEVSLALCAGARLEWLLASAPRVAEPGSDSAALWGALLSVQVRLPKASRVRLFGAAEAHLRFRKVHLDVEPFGRVLDLPAFGLSLLLGPELAF